MITLLLLSDFFPGTNEEPFLRAEFPYLEKQFFQIYIHRNNTVLSADNGYNFISKTKDHTPLRSLIKQHWRILLSALFTEMVKSPKRLHYILNYKKYISIWMGWLHETKSWELALKEFDPKETIIYTYWYENQAMPLTILRAQGKLPFKWVSRAHGWDVDKRQREEGLIPFRHWMLKNQPEHLVSVSEFGKRIFSRDYQSHADVARLGTKDTGLAKANKQVNNLKIVSISSLIPLKRVNLIIETLAQTNANIEWTHFGDGPLNKTMLWQSLPENIKCVRKGYLPNEKLMDELKSGDFDIMIHLSELEGIPVSIMECMSMGIPVIACDTGGVGEIVDDECGWLLDVDFDVNSIAKLLDQIALDKKIALEKRPLARAKWESEYQANVNFPKFIKTYLSKKEK